MKVKELKRTLELVKPGLASKEILEQATSIIFRDGKVWTFNDEVAVCAPLQDLELTGNDPMKKLIAAGKAVKHQDGKIELIG